MKIQGAVALVTGANGGIGKALVDELLRRGVSKIYIGGRSEAALSSLFAIPHITKVT